MKLDVADITKRINKIKITGETTFQEAYDQFFEIMKDHGIYQWHRTENGSLQGSSPEFVMCHSHFMVHIEMEMRWLTMMGERKDFILPDFLTEPEKKD